jgi:hypothetical protein
VEVKTDVNALASLGSDQVQGEDITKRISAFASTVVGERLPEGMSQRKAQEWLFDNLQRYQAFVDLNRLCRDGAKSYTQIKHALFGDATNAGEALDALLVLVSLAAKGDSVLFPVRLHMFMRGLQGLFACSNPHCSHAKRSDSERLPLGRVISIPRDRCSCGGSIYELVNHI